MCLIIELSIPFQVLSEFRIVFQHLRKFHLHCRSFELTETERCSLRSQRQDYLCLKCYAELHGKGGGPPK